jgi:hypothetical protein
MEAQEIFDTVATHLLKQGRRTTNPDIPEMCVYRGANGTKCAVGVLIPDEVYDPMMEGRTVVGLLSHPEFKIPRWMWNNETLLIELQNVHDVEHNWKGSAIMKGALSKVAKESSLTSEVLEELAFPWESKEVI